MALHYERIEIETFLDGVKQSFEQQIQQKNIHFIIESQPMLIHADRVRLNQIFINLVSNAVKYTTDSGTVHILGELVSGKAIFQVNDSGCGIEPGDLPFIFERFYRADKSRTRATGGSGIGLAIAMAMVKAHGGEISARSELGKGTSIRFVLPAFHEIVKKS